VEAWSAARDDHGYWKLLEETSALKTPQQVSGALGFL